MFPFFISFLLFFSYFPCTFARVNPRTLIHVSRGMAVWHDFKKFVNNEKSDREINGISDVKTYFHQFGYLELTDIDTNFTDVFDEKFELALMRYQSRLSLPVTKKLDSVTLSEIMAPRCGVGDIKVPKLHATNHFTFFKDKPRWSRGTPMKLTYSFSRNHLVDYLDINDIKSVFQRAFVRWASVIPVTFSEIENHDRADIKIGFYRGDHGDGRPFDGLLGILGHGFAPETGKLHLDAAETWAIDFGSEKSKEAVDLESVATHEIGHILGLAHSTERDAVMYPTLRTRTKKVDLRLDDVEGVQQLYGSNPNFKVSSLYESDISSGSNPNLIRFGVSRHKWMSYSVILYLLTLKCRF